MTTSATRCVIYLRISLDSTGEQLAVERQRAECRVIAKLRGWDIVGEYVDNSFGAYSKTRIRPGYDAMVKAYDAGEFDALVCWDLDRLTRQPRQLEDWIDKAEDRGLLLVTANGEADLSTDGGRLFVRIKASVARAESERKAARQASAAQQRAGLGKPPMGVRLTGYTTAGEIIETEAAAVREIFRRFYEGDSLKGIAAWLTGQGIATRHGGTWNRSSVRHILANPRYAGRSYYKRKEGGQAGTWVPGTWQPLVEDWLFDIVQDMLSAPQRRTQAGVDRKHLGSGLYLCGVCDRPVRSHGGAGKTDRRVRYRCPEGGHITRAAGPVDDLIELAVRAALADPGARRLTEPGTQRARDIAEDIRQLRGRLRKAELDYDADLIDGARYKAKTGKITAELDAAEASRIQAAAGLAIAPVLAAPDPVAAYDAMPVGGKRTVISALMTVRLARAPRGKHFDPATVVVEWR